MMKFLPQNLDLKQLLIDNPPSFKYHIDHFVHLCSLLHELPAIKKNSIRKRCYVSLNSYLLKKANHQYKKYIFYLIKRGVLECDNSYIVGEKSKCYRYTQKYQDIIQPVQITKYTLRKSLNEVHRFNRGMYAKYDYLYCWFDGLCVDFNKAEQKLFDLYRKDVDKGEENALSKFNANLVNLYKLDRKDYYFTVDSTSYRLHTLLTKIKKQLRPFITYENIELTNIDIQCSQPTLSLCLLDPLFYQTAFDKERVNINSIDPQLTKVLPIQTIAEYVTANQSKFNEYRSIVMNDLYVGMGEVLKAHSTGTPTDRNSVKDMMFVVLYSKNSFLGGRKALPKRIFKKMFPEVYEVFRMFKEDDATRLPKLLQKIEAKLMLDKVSKSIAKAERGLALYSIHDSIVCDSSKVDTCTKIFLKEAKKYLGFEPKLKPEVWNESNKELM